MSNDNLILFPKKSTSNITMSEADAKWMISGSLLVVLTIALGINASLFSKKTGPGAIASSADQVTGRQVASAAPIQSPALTNPLFRISWEKRAFEVLDKTEARDLASVGEKPSFFDAFAFGILEGKYAIRRVDGKIAEIQFSEAPDSRPKLLKERQQFIASNLKLFSEEASQVEQVQSVQNEQRFIEKFQMTDAEGHDLGTIQVLLDKDQNLLSMTVQ
jgi:hypothetical protein